MSVWSDVCRWGAKELGECLNDSGYSSDDLISAKFEALNDSCNAVFSIIYRSDDTESGTDEGRVFVWLNSSGVLSADF